MMADERLETAARAAFAAFGHDVAKPMPWEQAPEDFRITFRMVADAVLMVSEPLIREQIAKEIGAVIDTSPWYVRLRYGLQEAIEIIRRGGTAPGV